MIRLLCSKGGNERRKLTSFHSFPCAKRGYRGALGLAKAITFDTATSFGCWKGKTRDKIN